jgi:hypothetical protein
MWVGGGVCGWVPVGVHACVCMETRQWGQSPLLTHPPPTDDRSLIWVDRPLPLAPPQRNPKQVDMRAVRASAVVLPRNSDSNGGSGGGMPAAPPYMRETVSAPPAAIDTGYAYPPDVRRAQEEEGRERERERGLVGARKAATLVLPWLVTLTPTYPPFPSVEPAGVLRWRLRVAAPRCPSSDALGGVCTGPAPTAAPAPAPGAVAAGVDAAPPHASAVPVDDMSLCVWW